MESLKAREIGDLEEACQFLKNDLIKTFLLEWSKTSPFPCDNNDITTFLHKYGINLRYLGAIYDICNKNVQNPQMGSYRSIYHVMGFMIERMVFVRSLKHYIFEVLRSIDDYEICDTLAHIFNCIFANEESSAHITLKVKEIKNKLNSSLDTNNSKKSNGKNQDLSTVTVDPSDTNNLNSEGEVLSKREKKNQKRKQKKINKLKNNETLQLDSSYNKYQLITPSELFINITNIAKFKFRYSNKEYASFSELSFMETKMCKLSFLRDISLSIGLTIAEKNYKFYNEDNQIELPFKSQDFITLNPKIKHVQYPLDSCRTGIELASKFLAEKNTGAAIETVASH